MILLLVAWFASEYFVVSAIVVEDVDSLLHDRVGVIHHHEVGRWVAIGVAGNKCFHHVADEIVAFGILLLVEVNTVSFASSDDVLGHLLVNGKLCVKLRHVGILA